MTDHNEILGPSSSPTTGKLVEALAKAQGAYQAVKLDSSNPHFKSRFASYQQCCESLRGPLVANGLALPDFRPGLVNGSWVLVGTLRHISGEYLQGCAPLINPKNDMQGFGAAMTYAKRTLLMALTGGFAGEPDDDGQAVASQTGARTHPWPPPSATDVYKSLAYETGAKKAIAEAPTKAEAQKHLDTVRLRAKEKSVPVEVFRRVEEEFNRVWQKEAT
jgi:hypothetical protein